MNAWKHLVERCCLAKKDFKIIITKEHISVKKKKKINQAEKCPSWLLEMELIKIQNITAISLNFGKRILEKKQLKIISQIKRCVGVCIVKSSTSQNGFQPKWIRIWKKL